MEHLLTLQNLHVSYHTPRGIVQAVRGVDLTLDSGEVLAVVGESGCGKSITCSSIMGLLSFPLSLGQGSSINVI